MRELGNDIRRLFYECLEILIKFHDERSERKKRLFQARFFNR